MSGAGVVIVTREDWQAQLDALAALRPDCVRAHLYGNTDVDHKWGPAFTAGDLDAVRARLAPGGTLLLRTAESAVGADDLRYQLTSPFHDTARTVADYCTQTPNVVLEIGNEPDRAGLDPYVARFLVLSGLRVARSLLANVPICVSLPTVEAEDGYLAAMMSDTGDGLGRIALEADSLGWHCYGANTLEDSDYLHQRQQLATVCAYGLQVWITEAGINEARPWADRAVWYARFVTGLPTAVRGVCFYLLDSRDPQWAAYRLGVEGATALRAALTPPAAQTVESTPQISGVTPLTATQETTTMIEGIDLASHQGTQIDWQTVAAGNAFAIVKATGGLSYVNPLYQQQIAGARAAGLVVGHYHYAHESTVDGTDDRAPEDEARWFLLHADVQPGELVALDIEDTAIAGDLSDWALRWLRYVQMATGCTPLLYSFPDYIATRNLGTRVLAAYSLWYAHYWTPERDSPWPAVPARWEQIAIWQWSGGSTVPGSPTSTDRNVSALTVEALRALGKPQPVSPQVPTHPGGEGIAVAINERGETIMTINFGGTATRVDGWVIVDAGVSVVNAAGETYDRSVQGNTLGEWRKR